MKSLASKAPTASPRPRGRHRLARPLVLLVAVLVIVAGYYAYDWFLKPQPAPAEAAQAVAVTRGSVVAMVSTTGSVVPARTADLAFRPSGRLEELAVSVGQAVQQGDVLARLDVSDLHLQLVQAEAQLASAEAKVTSLESGSTPAEIAQARAQLTSAQAKLSQLKAGPSAADLLAAEASVASARSQLEKAETDLEKLLAGPTQDEITNAKVAIERAKIALHDAQVAYDKIAWRPDVGASREALELWKATVDYEAAEVSYNTRMAGPTAAELAIAESSVASARAQLESAEERLASLKQGPAADELLSAEAAVIQAQSQLDLKLNPTTEADMQVARASLEQAKAGVQTARNNLENAVMVAPFDGVVAAINATVGENVSGTVVSLLDLSSPQVQISLPEMDVAKVEVGQQALLTFEALGAQQVPGRVLSITPRATVQSGVATYTATIGIESLQRAQGSSDVPGESGSRLEGVRAGLQRQGAGVRPDQGEGTVPGTSDAMPAAFQSQIDLSKVKPGMTAMASIVYLRQDDVLVVPNRAIRAQGLNRVVDVMVDGEVETRVVTIGIADEQRTEIVDGLQEGEQVLIPGTTTSTAPAQVPTFPDTMPGGQGQLRRIP